MKLIDRFRSKTQNKSIQAGTVDSFASMDEARKYLSQLVDGYASNYKVDNSAQVLEAYRTIAQLKSIIDRSAKAFVRANKVLYKIEKNGEKVPVQEGDLYNVFNDPHVLQSMNEFWETFYINWQLYGVVYTLKNYLPGFGLDSMLALASLDVTTVIKKNPNYLNPKDISDIIHSYVIHLNDTEKEVITHVEKIWTLQGTSLKLSNNGYLIPENPLKAIEKQLGVLKIIADIKTELLGNYGAIGIISPEGNKDDAGTAPLLPKDKKRLQKEYLRYGITKGKRKLVISNKQIKFTAISLPIADLLLTEFEETASNVLAQSFSFPISLINDNVKYENRDGANKELYENKIIPESNIIEESVKAEFELTKNNMDFEFDFSHIGFLQADQQAQAETNKITNEIIIELNAAVKRWEVGYDQAINSLIMQGMTKEDAQSIITKHEKPKANENTNV